MLLYTANIAMAAIPHISYVIPTVVMHIQRFLNTVYDAKCAVDEDNQYSLKSFNKFFTFI